MAVFLGTVYEHFNGSFHVHLGQMVCTKLFTGQMDGLMDAYQTVWNTDLKLSVTQFKCCFQQKSKKHHVKLILHLLMQQRHSTQHDQI